MSYNPPNMQVIDGQLKSAPKGSEKSVTTGSSAQGLPSIPLKAITAQVSVESQSIRYWDNGADPTATEGHLITAGTSFYFTCELSLVRMIEVASGAKIQVSYYLTPTLY